MVLKGHHPQFIFEIVPPNNSPDCLKIEYEEATYHIMVLKFPSDQVDPPTRYLIEMLKWYAAVKAKPSLQEIGGGKMIG